MAIEDTIIGSTPKAHAPTFHANERPLSGSKGPQSAPDSSRRYSLPLHFLPPSLWSANTSSASLVESEEAARGEHILDEATVANRISTLRQLNGATRSRHRYAKSTGARNSTFSQPVIVRTYSGAARPRPQRQDPIAVKKENGLSKMTTGNMELKLPPVEAFTFKGIMDEIRQGVTEDLERIAEICARSRYSLSNQYEVHMPPHGRGEPILQTPGLAFGLPVNVGGPTLQAVGSDDEQPRHTGRGSRGGRRTKSVAYGTLETIMSSSRSSDEDKSKKKPAAVLAEEVRGRAAKKDSEVPALKNDPEDTAEAGPSHQRPSKHIRSKSATFASMIIDNAQSFKQDTVSQHISPASLISEPAKPRTSTATDLENIRAFGQPMSISPGLQPFISPKPSMTRNDSNASTLTPEPEWRHSILGSLGSWISWGKQAEHAERSRGQRRSSHAEGSLRDLLRSAEVDRKGKTVDRNG